MFNNAWLYNRKTSRVYKYCSKLAEVFESEIDPVMQGLGYCCGRKVSWSGQKKCNWKIMTNFQRQQPTLHSNLLRIFLNSSYWAFKWFNVKRFDHLSHLIFPVQFEFSPQTLCCYGKQLCTIPTGGTYYSYQNRYQSVWHMCCLWTQTVLGIK